MLLLNDFVRSEFDLVKRKSSACTTLVCSASPQFAAGAQNPRFRLAKNLKQVCFLRSRVRSEHALNTTRSFLVECEGLLKREVVDGMCAGTPPVPTCCQRHLDIARGRNYHM